MASVRLSATLYFGIHPSIVLPSFVVDHFVDLTRPGEVPKAFTGEPAEVHRFPVRDRCALSPRELAACVDHILALEGVVYVFCKGGHGRSGMAAAAVHGRREGLNGALALAAVLDAWRSQRDLARLSARVRKLGAPQTRVQKYAVCAYLGK